ncbi:MAG TPA: RNA-binding domain-containing protein [Clostridia bacterium]
MLSVLDLITGGESKFLEFKQDYATSMHKTVSAFANSHDGRVLFGVSDAGQILGVENSQELRMRIENAINDSIQPRPYYEIEALQAEGHDILILKVFKGEYTPYYFHNKAYIRSDTTSVEADRILLNQLILAGQNIHFDETSSTDQALTFNALERIMRQRMKIGALNADLLKSLGLIKEDQYTNAAALLSDQNPVDNAVLVLLVYSPDHLSLVDRNTLENLSVLIQFEACLEFLPKHSQVFEKIVGAYRQTLEEIPLIAYREAVANAIVHRDYQMRGQIKVEFHMDRVEITSPGPLPVGISEEEYLDGRLSIPRNRTLADIFLRMGMIEKLAAGIRRIKESYQGREKQPSFVINENSITVILPKALMDSGTKVPETPVLYILSKDEGKILAHMEGDVTINRLEISDLLSLGKTRTYQLIHGLVEKHLIYPVGSGKSTRYKRIR